MSQKIFIVTNVFREMSNAPIEEQRDYMFECLSYDSSQKSVAEQNLFAIKNSIIAAVEEMPIFSDIKKIFITESASIACHLIFRIAMKLITPKVNPSNSEETIVSLDLSAIENYKIDVKIKKSIVDRLLSGADFKYGLCTLYDFCSYELLNDNVFNLYCLNADITPWRVTPKKGYSIKKYNFAVNYINNKVFENFSAGYKQSLNDAKANIREFSRNWSSNALIPYDDFAANNHLTAENVDAFTLKYEEEETMDEYYKRFMLHKAAAPAGTYLKSIRLKSDVIYENFADVCNEPKVQSDTYAPIVDGSEDKRILTQFDVQAVNTKLVDAIETKGNRISPFDLKEEEYADIINWLVLFDSINNIFKHSCFLVGDVLYAINSNGDLFQRSLTDLTCEQCRLLVERHIMYQLSSNKFLIKTVSGFVQLEVMI